MSTNGLVELGMDSAKNLVSQENWLHWLIYFDITSDNTIILSFTKSIECINEK